MNGEQLTVNSDTASDTEVIIIGTLHGGHFQAKHYTAQVVKDILIALKPDAICVELYSRFFNPDGTLTDEALSFGDCPEVQTTNEAAAEMGIRQIPYDREGRNEWYAEHNFFEREQEWLAQFEAWGERLREDGAGSDDFRLVRIWKELLQSQIQLNTFAAPDVINSSAYDGVIYSRHSIEHLFAKAMRKYPEMQDAADFMDLDSRMCQERDQAMVRNLTRIASEFPGGRLAVTTGSEHRHMLREILADQPGIVLREYWEVNSER